MESLRPFEGVTLVTVPWLCENVTAEQDVATLSLRTRDRKESCDSRIGLYLISLGELYLHEPDALRLRVEELLRRNKRRIVTYNAFHAHRYACGTFLTCEARPVKPVRRTDAAIVMRVGWTGRKITI